ncbi:hypothetical protein [Curtobacterium sp. 1544]|uniref:hypothetical protein n=1 Tax=Curtobacterium sp. 1544 TaxID=3156417 RepID=UPI003392AA3F
MFGPFAQFLKRNWILPIVIFASATVALLATRVFLDGQGNFDPAWTPWVVGFGIAAALAAILDKIADSFDKRNANRALEGSERTAENSVTDLNAFVAEAVEVSFLEGASRVNAIRGLRRSLVQFAAKSIGPGTRATYYTLDPTTPGARVLGDAQHAVEYGRHDKPPCPFVETESPDHDVWRILERPDEEPEVLNAPDAVQGVDWTRKPYKCFISVPVKAHGVQFGLLSVNNSEPQSIGGAQRETIITMARVMALALAMDLGPRVLTSREAEPQMSSVAGTLTAPQEMGVEDDSPDQHTADHTE